MQKLKASVFSKFSILIDTLHWGAPNYWAPGQIKLLNVAPSDGIFQYKFTKEFNCFCSSIGKALCKCFNIYIFKFIFTEFLSCSILIYFWNVITSQITEIDCKCTNWKLKNNIKHVNWQNALASRIHLHLVI